MTAVVTPAITIVTLTERKNGEAARRVAAIAAVRPQLAARARELGGRYLVFGSAARNAVRHDSDLDLLLDFPDEASSRAAAAYARSVCAGVDLPVDVLPIDECEDAMLAYIGPELRPVE